MPKMIITDGEGHVEVVPDQRPLDVQKAEKIAELEAVRFERGETFVYDGVVTPARPAIADITAAVVAAQLSDPSATFPWKLAAGEFRLFTLPDLIAFGMAVRAHVQTTFEKEAYITGLILMSQDSEALDNIDFYNDEVWS